MVTEIKVEVEVKVEVVVKVEVKSGGGNECEG